MFSPPAPETIDDALKRATALLMGKSGAPRLDAQHILAHVLGQPREFLIAHGEALLSAHQSHVYDRLLTLRARGMPLPYILGKRAFFDRTLVVTPHVLIPRPETEHIVEHTLDWVQQRQSAAPRIVDVGTGSGAIAVTLAAHLPHAVVYATDISAAALLVARHNGAGLPNLRFVQSDLLAALSGPFDVIAANLPYIATGDLDILEVAKFEPHIALDGGPDGLCLIRRLLAQAPARLARPGLILLEMASDHGAAVAALARAAFPTEARLEISIRKDYAGVDRVAHIARY